MCQKPSDCNRMMIKMLAAGCLWLPLAARTAAGARETGRAGPAPFAVLFACELETYCVLDGRETLTGKLTPTPSAKPLLSEPAPQLRVRLVPLSPGVQPLQMDGEVAAGQPKKELPLAIPVGRLPGGYYRMEGELIAAGGAVAARREATDATGTTVKVTVPEDSGYENMVPSTPLADRWSEHIADLGVAVQPVTSDERMGSTDMGNISQVIPSIHPYIAVAPEGTPGHSTAFRDAAGTPPALDNAILAAKAMALTAIDVLADRSLLEGARDECERRKRDGMVRGR